MSDNLITSFLTISKDNVLKLLLNPDENSSFIPTKHFKSYI